MSEQRQDLRELLKRNSKLTKENQMLKEELANLINKLRTDDALIVFKGSELHLNEHKLNLAELP